MTTGRSATHPTWLLKLAATGAETHHTDKNVLHRVRRYHPGSDGG